MVFHKTSKRPIPLKSMMSPFGIKTTIRHVFLLERFPFQKSAWTISATFLQCVPSGSSSHVASLRYFRSCSACISDMPPERFMRNHITAQVTSFVSGTESNPGKGGHIHQDGMDRRWHVLVELQPLCHHALNGHYVWRGGGGLYLCTIPVSLSMPF